MKKKFKYNKILFLLIKINCLYIYDSIKNKRNLGQLNK